MELKLSDKKDYARAVCIFLAEGLRTRQITLQRGADIAQKVVNNLSLIDTEYDFLRLIKELSKDFEELVKLEDRVFMHVKSDERIRMEAMVKEFVVEMLTADTAGALSIMDAAIKESATTDELAERFPDFKAYLDKKKINKLNASGTHFRRL